jgi:opacity protein-like surface antigen
VNIPLLLSINTNKTRIINLNIVAGPQLGINVGSNIKKLNGGSSDSLSGIFGVKKNDIGIVYGAGLEFMVNDRRTIRLGLGYRGMFGFTNISNTSQTIDNTSYYILNTANIRSNAIYIGLSFLL